MTERAEASADAPLDFPPIPSADQIPTRSTVLHFAMLAQGLMGIVYGSTALTHPALLEPLHKAPSEQHLHWFRLHGIAQLFAGLFALYSATFIRDRVHTYWIGAGLWIWTVANAYVSFLDYNTGRNTTFAMIGIMGSMVAIWAVAFLIVSVLPGSPVTSHRPHHAAHHARQADHERRFQARHAAEEEQGEVPGGAPAREGQAGAAGGQRKKDL